MSRARSVPVCAVRAGGDVRRLVSFEGLTRLRWHLWQLTPDALSSPQELVSAMHLLVVGCCCGHSGGGFFSLPPFPRATSGPRLF